MAYRLGIDLGTTNTVATIAVDGASVQLLGLGAGAPQTRSMLVVAEDGQLLVGDAVAARAASDPSRLIVDPRRELGTDTPMVVGGQEVTAEQATAAVLAFIRERAVAQQGEAPADTVLSCPSHWSDYQLECFDRAVATADLGPVRRCTEAEAAASTYAARNPLADGRRVVVYDLGGGSCEVTVLEKTPAGFKAFGTGEGADHPSGADFDEAVFRLVLGGLGDRGRDLKQDDPATRARLAEIRRGCTQAKEELSTQAEAAVTVTLPGYATTVKLSRREFESLIRPALRESIAMTTRALRGAGTQAADLAAIVLVGGCVRMPIVAELLRREFEVPIALGTHPEYDVAFGALLTPQPGSIMTPGSIAMPAPVGSGPVGSGPVGSGPVGQASSQPIDAPVVQDPAVEESHSSEEPHSVEEARAAEEAPAAHAGWPPTSAVATVTPPVVAAAEPTLTSAEPAGRAPTVGADDQPTEPLPAAVPTSQASADSYSRVPGPEAPAPSQEETMADHLIFDYFTSTEADPEETPPERAASRHDRGAKASPPVPIGAGWPAGASGPVVAGGPPTLPQWAQASAAPPPAAAAHTAAAASSPYPTGQRPPGNPPQRPGPYPPGQYPQGQNPQGRPGGPPPGYRGPGPQTQPGQRGPGGPGGGYPGGPGGSGGSGNGPSRRLILIIAGIVVLVGLAFGVGLFLSRQGNSGANPTPSFVPPPQGSSTPSSSLTATPSGTPSTSASPSPTPSGSASSPGTQSLPSAAAIPESVVVVPMRRGGGSDRPLYLVDSEGKINRVKLPTPAGGNSNPVMQASRTTIIYANAGVLRVMATDGSADRKLFNRDPAGCAKVEHASWSLADPNVMLISCKISKNRDGFLVVDLDGLLIRRLDPGKKVIGDFGLSPDGQTVAYWAADSRNATGGAIYTLPLIGTGAPKQLTSPAGGVDADPAWSPDATQIAFRRRVNDGTAKGNFNVFVMNADGSAARAVATTAAADFKPIWSPDNKNLLIISNRKSAFGGPGKTLDLWLTRVSDGEVLTPLGLKAKDITRPFWTLR